MHGERRKQLSRPTGTMEKVGNNYLGQFDFILYMSYVLSVAIEPYKVVLTTR